MNHAHPVTVSVIIPVYNGADRIRRAVDSVLAQTHPATEIFVIDDGSTIPVASQLSGYPVTIIEQQNSGPGAARNTGAERATGEWLAFLDHDDAWHPEKTKEQLKQGLDPEVGVIYTPLNNCPFKPVTFPSLWKKNVVGFPTGTMVRRKCFQQVGGFDSRRELIATEDYNLWLRIALTNWRFAACEARWFEYTPAVNSLSANHLRMAQAELASLDSVGKLAGLNARIVSHRKASVVNEYVREMIGARNISGARAFIAGSGFWTIRPDLLIAAFGPNWLLELRRLIRGRYVRFTSPAMR